MVLQYVILSFEGAPADFLPAGAGASCWVCSPGSQRRERGRGRGEKRKNMAVFVVATKARRFCRAAGCPDFADKGSAYCEKHKPREEEAMRQRDARRGSARKRGYDSRWSKYSKAFLRKPENQFCVLRLDARCAVVSQCVDHIDPPTSASDPKFWQKENHQPSCLRCNSIKGNRKMRGEARPPGG